MPRQSPLPAQTRRSTPQTANYGCSTRSAFLGGEYVNDRSIKLSKSARNVIDDYIEEFRINYPVPLWLFDALVLVVDREPVRGVVHV
ncbi:hypothetical protein ACLQ3C_21590, partial [Gordonia sp. DT30]